jgi:Pin2-interacting protein X1
VHHKLDILGIGAQHTKDLNGVAWKQNRDFEDLLKRLNASSEGPTEDEVDPSPIVGFHPARVGKLVGDAATVGSETGGRVEEKKLERERENKKKKRVRDDGETAEMEERKPKKRKKVESTTAAPTSEPGEVGPSSSNSPTPETVAFVVIDHSHSKASLDS